MCINKHTMKFTMHTMLGVKKKRNQGSVKYCSWCILAINGNYVRKGVFSFLRNNFISSSTSALFLSLRSLISSKLLMQGSKITPLMKNHMIKTWIQGREFAQGHLQLGV